jgi:ATP-dependent protease ClpP protease subunit
MKPQNSSVSARLGWRVVNVEPTHAEVDLFDVLGDDWFGVSAKDFVQELRALDVETLTININSPGGFVDSALSMFDAIQQHPARVTARIVVAASAASFVAQAADERIITRNGKLFVHDAQGFGLGNAADMRSLADMLDGESENIADIYAQRSGGTVTDWRDRMRANDGIGSTYRGQEAVDVGLADAVAEAPARNIIVPHRAAAHADDDAIEIPTDLIPLAANGYRPPVPQDFTRLVEQNLKKEPTNG